MSWDLAVRPCSSLQAGLGTVDDREEASKATRRWTQRRVPGCTKRKQVGFGARSTT